MLAAPLVVLAVYWNDLPERIPLHWDWRGQIDAWGTKSRGIFVIPLTALGLTALLRVLPWFDPKLRRSSNEAGRMPAVLPIVRLASLLLLDAVFFVQVAISLGKNVAGGRILLTCLPIFFVILGNYLGNLRPNYFIGICTPSTLENPETWRAPHRLGGRRMFFGALILLGVGAFLSESTFSALFVG